MEENFLQGDEEKLLGLPVQALNDREKANLPYGQIGFIEYLVAPVLLTITKVQGGTAGHFTDISKLVQKLPLKAIKVCDFL